MRRVIVNSTPLIALCNAGLLKLLKEIYGTITIPRAVFDEVTAKQDSACTQIKDNLDWITVEEIKDIADRKMYKAKLHAVKTDIRFVNSYKWAEPIFRILPISALYRSFWESIPKFV